MSLVILTVVWKLMTSQGHAVTGIAKVVIHRKRCKKHWAKAG